jgi:hypothetical protein
MYMNSAMKIKLFMRHVLDPDRPVEVKKMAVKQVAR